MNNIIYQTYMLLSAYYWTQSEIEILNYILTKVQLNTEYKFLSGRKIGQSYIFTIYFYIYL